MDRVIKNTVALFSRSNIKTGFIVATWFALAGGLFYFMNGKVNPNSAAKIDPLAEVILKRDLSGHYRAEAKSEHFGQQVIRAPRGALLDRDGYPLATTVDAYDLYIERHAWQDRPSARRWARPTYRSTPSNGLFNS